MNSVEAIIYLCKCAVNEQKADPDRVADVDLDGVYYFAQKHMLAAAVGLALADAGVQTPEFRQAIAMAKRKTVVLNSERAAVCRALNQAGIWHMPLKGSVLKDWYPQFGMRESADVDLLVDPEKEAQVRAIMTAQGYETQSYGDGHHDVYFKKPLTNMQMHVALFGPGYPEALNEYFGDVKARLVPKAESEFAFTPEDFYLYAVAHAWDHFEKGGTGLRTVLDTYVMLRRLTLDWDAVFAACARLGVGAFEEKNRALAMHLFGDGALTEADRETLNYMIGSGAHGTLQNTVRSKVRRYGGGPAGKMKYILKRLFLPMGTIRRHYPTFYKY
ncbi:MAG: nucleotidyltransferase family protein, partial [Clostridia bacterium]|nr:nucleotidyltransferase family protein [Clostridia bacterium]